MYHWFHYKHLLVEVWDSHAKECCLVFWDVTPCCVVGRYQSFRGSFCMHCQGTRRGVLPWRLRHQVHLKCWCISAWLHSITLQETINLASKCFAVLTLLRKITFSFPFEFLLFDAKQFDVLWNHLIRFVGLHMVVSVMAPYSLASGYWCVRQMYCCNFQGRGTSYQTMWSCNQEEHMNAHHCRNLKSHLWALREWQQCLGSRDSLVSAASW